MKRQLEEDEGENVYEENGDDETEEEEYLKDTMLIDMNKITEVMTKRVILQTVVCGFSLYGIGLQAPGSMTDTIKGGNRQVQYYKQLNKEILKELVKDIGIGSTLSVVNTTQITKCYNFYKGNSTIRLSSTIFKGELFKTPFDIKVVNQGTPLAELNDDIKELIIDGFWMPFLRKHCDWIKIVGVCPFYFEPIGIKTSGGKIVIHYVPQVPDIMNGILYTYTNTKGRQSFVWKWTTAPTASPFSGIHGTSLTNIFFPVESENGYYNGYNGSNFLAENLGTLPFSINSPGKNGKSSSGETSFFLKKSKYMFYDVQEAPLLNGNLKSDIMSIIPEWDLLNEMLDQMLVGGRKGLNPKYFVEYSPNLGTATSGDQIDMLRLHIELIKERNKSPLFGLDNYSSVFGQDVPTPMDQVANQLESAVASGAGAIGSNSALSRVWREREQLLGQYNTNISAEADLNLSSYDPTLAPRLPPGNIASRGEYEKMLLYAKNHPGSDVDIAVRRVQEQKLRDQNDCTYLNPYEKVSSAGPKITVPNYDLKFIYSRLDKIISSMSDFPLELFQSSAGSQATKTQSTGKEGGFGLKMDLFKVRLEDKSKNYENLIRQMWIMAYAPFLKKKKRDLKKNQKFLEYDINFIHIFEQILCSFPRTPFLEMVDYIYMYRMGLIDEQKLYDFISDRYGLEKKVLTEKEKGEIKEKMKLLYPDEMEQEMAMNNIGGGAAPKKKKRKSEGDSGEEPAKKKKKKEKD